MVDCLHYDTLAMGAGGGLGAVYVEEVLVEWGMACAKLGDDGGLAMVEFINKL